MPVLKDTRKIAKTSIPSVEGSEVEIFDSLLVGDADVLVSSELTDFQRMLKALERLIKSWNLTDEKGVALPINGESLGKLNFPDIEHLISKTSYGVDLGKLKASSQS